MIQPFRPIGTLAALYLSMLAAWAGPCATPARAQLNPQTGDYSPAALEEQRAQRKDAREELAQRQENDYRLTVPIVGAEAIEATRAALARYETIAAEGGWGVIPDGVTIRLDDSSETVESLRRRFGVMGDSRGEADGSPFVFDKAMQDAVGRYQIRNGLSVTGFVDQPTRRALNVRADVRAQQLRTNLARLESLEKATKSGRYVLVNVPDFRLQAVEDGQLALDSRVVVGRPTRETPEISAKIIELNFHPTLHLPDSIARLDLLPKLRVDPLYLESEQITVLKRRGGKPVDQSQIDWNGPEALKYKFRQAPGPRNPLGQIRINMPNKHIVYLHDTPLKELYASASPAFSSGCVRVERVADLAVWLAQGAKGWDESKVRSAIQQGKPISAKISKAVPVHFVYVTAWATPDGTTHFRPDIYNRDGSGDPGEREDVAGVNALSP